MTDRAVATRDTGAILEQVVVQGDLAKLSPGERVTYYKQTCESLGLNPLTQPFQYITLNGKLTLYARRDCTDQLRKIHHVSITIVGREHVEDSYVVTARATLPDGRVDESIGVVTIGGLKGDALANALMKAETKSKRRVTLSIVGLGCLDETEVETIPDAQPYPTPARPVPPKPEPPKPADSERMAKLMVRWEALWEEAHEVGLNPDPLPFGETPEIIIARGKELAQQIAEARASQ